MARELADSLLDGIVDGQYAISDTLPPEVELADAAGVSRLTVREAVGNLRARNIVAVRRGLGTFVNPLDSWSDLDAVMYASVRRGDARAAEQLLEVRRVVEVGAAELAARNRDSRSVSALDRAIEDLEEADSINDGQAATNADLAFHDAILRATENAIMQALYAQLRHTLELTRQLTSSRSDVRKSAISHHRAIRDAIAAGDVVAAGHAMSAHMDQTSADYRRLVGPEGGRDSD
ncbi:MAG: FadR family transcriptional regulator [Bifidobacteriaceae bacterium]|nr:FadR family transcriptional regulator [Bifidobacteriaceae bacterium]